MGGNARCPTCKDDSFESEKAMKIHHKLAHGKSLAIESSTCQNCGCEFEFYPSEKKGYWCPDCVDGVGGLSGKMHPHYGKKGNDAPYGGHTHSEETKKKISKGSKEWHAENTFENPPVSEERKEQLRKEMSGKNNPRYGKHPSPNFMEVEETGHTVRSSWEAEVDKMLYHAQVDYEYEPKVYDLSIGITYRPDFVVGDDTVIEVKGFVTDRSLKQANAFGSDYPEYRYIVVGSKMPCDIHIPWENRRNLTEKIDD